MNLIESFTDNINKTVMKSIDNVKKGTNNVIDSVGSNAESRLNSTNNIIESGIRSVERSTNSITKSIDNEANKNINFLLRGYNNFIDWLYKTLFNLLIVPLDRTARISSKNFGFLNLFFTFITLLITNINDTILKNSVDKVITTSEKAVGYKLDGRPIGPKKKDKKSRSLPLFMKILRSILLMIATILDLILLALVNQVDVFANIVKNLIKG